MRIISGRFRGRRLLTPEGRDVRPATDRVRESIFNLISARTSLEAAKVLDLFCGTGSLGLEALSRGAQRATFVEANRNVMRIARENALRLGVADQCDFFLRDAVRFVRSSAQVYDLILADPPYDLDGLPELPPSILPLLSSDGLFFLEHDKIHDFANTPGWIESRKYGRTIVSIFEANHEET